MPRQENAEHRVRSYPKLGLVDAFKPGVSGKAMLAIFFATLSVTVVWIGSAALTQTGDRSAMDSYHSRKAGGPPPASDLGEASRFHERRLPSPENSGLITPSV